MAAIENTAPTHNCQNDRDLSLVFSEMTCPLEDNSQHLLPTRLLLQQEMDHFMGHILLIGSSLQDFQPLTVSFYPFSSIK
mmetsp:Transcript_2533/g.5432  ORF Transcript_2533/g.5432 Transcript_2533/m.5432 type:complete len:80 (-) Transcript_2533:58-297(-)